jgi:ABC-2 type transport system ATP-binding protein
MKAALSFNDVHLRYSDHAVLQGLSFSVAAGEIAVLLGGNGAGKTSALECALGLARPSMGRIAVFGQAVVPGRSVDPRIAFIPESVGIYDELSARETLRLLGAVQHGTPPQASVVESLLDRVGFPSDARSRRLALLSKGMRQKVALALGLGKGASLMLLDEPTSGLDVPSAKALNAILIDIARSGVSVLMTTHDLLRARELPGRGLILTAGRIVDEVATQDLDLDAVERQLA